MKNLILVILLIFTTISFAQKPTNSVLNYKKSSDDLFTPNSSNLSLNMHPFKYENFIQNNSTLSEMLRESNDPILIPSGTMPIFTPEGKFFLETYDVNNNNDYKLRIFDLEKSKYFWRSMG